MIWRSHTCRFPWSLTEIKKTKAEIVFITVFFWGYKVFFLRSICRTTFLDRLPQLPRVWMVFEMSVSVREMSGSYNQTKWMWDFLPLVNVMGIVDVWRLGTHGMMGAQLKGVRREHSNGKETQEHKAAHGRVLNMWVSCGESEIL